MIRAMFALCLACAPAAALADSPESADLSASASPQTVQGQIALTHWTIDAGGGYLSAGNIVLQGTVGQPDAGRLTGGGIVLRSGFWAGAMAAPGDAIFMDGFEN